MAPNRGPIRAWKEEEAEIEEDSGSEQDQEFDENESSENGEDDHSASESEGHSDEEDDEEDVEDGRDPENLQPDLADISFGALAKAQESLSSGKRKRQSQDQSRQDTLNELRTKLRKTSDDSRSRKKSSDDQAHRSSKHAPAVQSSKKAVSRKRVIFSPPPSAKFRDPRFDAAVNSSSSSASIHANKNYSFLSDYRDSEIQDLQKQIKKAKNPNDADGLKRELMSLKSKQRIAKQKQMERDLVKEQRQKEKEAIREGRKENPYYMKKGELKREVLKKELESMGRRAREKQLKRKRKKEAGKEKKMMPMDRRSAMA